MRKRIWLAALALLLLPRRGTEVGKLLPVETLLIEKQAGQYRVSTDTVNTGRGDSLEKAVDALRAEAPVRAMKASLRTCLLRWGFRLNAPRVPCVSRFRMKRLKTISTIRLAH